MEEAFPTSEIRTYEGQLSLLENPYYWLKLEKDEQGKLLAFMGLWEFEQFHFVEHLAVSKEARGGGIGGKMVRQLLQENDRLVILEVEPPCDDITRRRIQFYKRLGFHLNEFYYEQPPMREGGPWCPLKIMSYPYAITQQEFEAIKKVLYQKVYTLER